MAEKTLTRSEQKRSSILEAATNEFKEKGFQGASMDRISERAGVSKRTVYNHFPSKEDLFSDISDNLWQRMKAAEKLEYTSEIPMAQQLEAFAAETMTLYASEDYIGLSRCILAEYMHSETLARQAMTKFTEDDSALERWIQSGINDKRLKKGSPVFMATQFFYLLKGFGFWPQTIGHSPVLTSEEQQQVIQSSVSMFLNQYQLKE
ncbi:TetR/AcrR family transcriptional regulator [Endozoicomonas lisbonensis]